MAKNDPRAIAALRGPERPVALEYLWEMYLEITGNRFGGASIEWSDVAGYATVRGITLSTFEAGVLLEIDRIGTTVSREGKA